MHIYDLVVKGEDIANTSILSLSSRKLSMASSSTAPAHQQPTSTNTFIRTTEDARKILYATLLGRLPMISRRLDSVERHALRSG